MKLMLIGGGDNGYGTTNYETKEIDEEIVKMTNKQEPIFLFIGLASSFSYSYYDVMKKIYQNLGCKTTYLKKKNIINNPDITENKIENSLNYDRLSDEELDQLIDDNKTILEELESLLDRVNHENTKLYLENEIETTKSFISDLGVADIKTTLPAFLRSVKNSLIIDSLILI